MFNLYLFAMENIDDRKSDRRIQIICYNNKTFHQSDKELKKVNPWND